MKLLKRKKEESVPRAAAGSHSLSAGCTAPCLIIEAAQQRSEVCGVVCVCVCVYRWSFRVHANLRDRCCWRMWFSFFLSHSSQLPPSLPSSPNRIHTCECKQSKGNRLPFSLPLFSFFFNILKETIATHGKQKGH